MSQQKVFTFPKPHQHFCLVVMALGVVGLGLGFAGILTTAQRAWANFLLNAVYVITVSVFGLFFVALHHLTGARWSELLRKIPEAMSRFLPVGAVLMLLSLFGLPHLYEWSHNGIDGAKRWYLNAPFFAARMALIVGLWCLFSLRFQRYSALEDSGKPPTGISRIRMSAAFVVLFALSFAVASFDWIMSLEPHWFSTVFAVYHFSGVFVAGIATISVISITLKNIKVLKHLNENHIHDLGKYLFAFSMFWAYIWYCQYMLIWYGNIPEETVYYANRLKDDWNWLFYFNFFLNFVVPFFVLLPRACKRSAAMVLRISIVLLVGHWLDLYLMIMPPVAGAKSNIGILEVATAAAFAAAFVFFVGRALATSPVQPPPSPLLSESLQHHQP